MDKKRTFTISGMTCSHCEMRVVGAVKKISGVSSASASFSRHRLTIAYNPEKIDEATLDAGVKKAVEQDGYKVLGTAKDPQPIAKVIPVVIILLALYLILRYTVGFDFFGFIPKIDSTISLSALFLTGILTSVHCVAMCGGINLSQSVGTGAASASKLKNPLLYNLGRVISYTIIGGVVGGIGSVLFLSETLKAVILAIAALGMLLMGLSMLGWLPWWLTPRMPTFLAKPLGKAGIGKGPLVVGLLNGLMPCGPLQAMQLYALASGSALTGALSMLLFSLGTVPLMLGAGALFSTLKGKFAYVVQRVSAVLVVLFAVVMAASALSLLGIRATTSVDAPQAANATNAPSTTTQKDADSLLQQALDKGYLPATIEGGVQTVQANLNPSVYPFIIVQKGIPVELTITADEANITGCNQTVVLPSYNVKKTLAAGDNVIKFTPDKTGLISYTCWMGMLDGRILVVDDLSGNSAATDTPAVTAAPAVDSADPNINTTNAQGGYCSTISQQLTKDSIAVAKQEGDVQTITIQVDANGYSPAILVLQRGVTTRINVAPSSLSYCNSYIDFGKFGSLDLSANQLTLPDFTADQDFTFTCAMNLLQGYVKVVDDVKNVDLDGILLDIQNGTQASGANSTTSGCCG